MIITEDPSNFYINLIKRRELFPMFTIEKNNVRRLILNLCIGRICVRGE